MNTLLITFALFALVSVALASTAPFQCYYSIHVSCVGGNKTCSTSCTPSLTNTIDCIGCKGGLICNNGICANLPTQGQPCGPNSASTFSECWDTSAKGYQYACTTTGTSSPNQVCAAVYPFSAGESGCSTSSYDSFYGGCDYGNNCTNGKCAIVSGSATCTIDGECGPSSYCQHSSGNCKSRLGAGSDCSTDTNGCALNLVAQQSKDLSTCTCTSLFSLANGASCNDYFVCASGFCNASASGSVCQPSGLNAGKSCASDTDCIPANVADYFPTCNCGSGSHGSAVAKGVCEYLGFDSGERSEIQSLANCEANNVDYGLRTDATHGPNDFTFALFDDGVQEGGDDYHHYVPGGAVDSACGPTLRKYLVGVCGGGASVPQIISALFALAIAVALLF